MPNHCENCSHWQKQEARPGAVAGNIGECHAEPPKVSYNWPRTHGTSYCSQHSSARFAIAQPTAPKRKGSVGQLPLEG